MPSEGREMPGSVQDHEAERFWSKVDVGDCWEWTGAKAYGYGQFTCAGKHWRAHRFAYTALVGPIPTGMQLDHLCRNKACVNPDHLEVVTPRENTLRGVGLAARNAKKTHCLRGHPLTPENLAGRSTWRQCLVCAREADAKRRSPTTIIDSGGCDSLTAREMQALSLMAEGLSNLGIAERMSLAEGTIEKLTRDVLWKVTGLEYEGRPRVNRRVLAVLRYLEARP